MCKKLFATIATVMLCIVASAQPGRPFPQHHQGPQLPQMMSPEARPMLIISGKEANFEDFMKIPPQEIESLSVFHDSDFTKGFGEKAKNGIIMVRLKSDKPDVVDQDGMTGNIAQLIVPTETIHAHDEELPGGVVPYSSLTEEPTFLGEDSLNFVDWLSGRITRPEGCTHSGRMIVSFVIQANGKVKDVKIERGVCEVLDALVKRVVSDSPDWTPGYIDDMPVNVMYSLPVVFRYR